MRRSAVEARYYEKLDEAKVHCHLCPHECLIADSRSGYCRVRRNDGGTLLATTYGKAAAVAMDPIEKKPLYHFHPGNRILSIGQACCTFRCTFCQNYHLMEPDIPQQDLPPEAAMDLARTHRSIGIAYTYNEPYAGFEYVLDTSRLARQAGMKNVLVTNGYYMPAPFEELAPLTDAMNIDLKSMSEEFYAAHVHGELAPVQRTIETALGAGIHVELTNLLITGLNDSPRDVTALVDYVAGLGADIPLHFSRYHPAYKMTLPPTSLGSLDMAHEIARKRLDYVYLGNVVGMEGSDTTCPACGAVLVRRSGYATSVAALKGRTCGNCGAAVNFVV